MHKGVLAINKYGKFKFFKINCSSIAELDIQLFPPNIKKTFGLGAMSRECDFNHDNRTISIFAFTDGVAGEENKYELPPPIDQTLYFGCLIVIAHNNNSIITITQEIFDKFYDKSFDGFVNLGDEDTWSEEMEENSDDREFIVDDDFIEYGSGETSSTEEEYSAEDTTDSDEGETSDSGDTETSDEGENETTDEGGGETSDEGENETTDEGENETTDEGENETTDEVDSLLETGGILNIKMKIKITETS